MDDDEKAARDNDLWLANNVLKFWFACPTKRCRRARSCVGDPARCHAIFWPVVPEEIKVWWRTLLDSHRTGRTATQAGRAAGEAMAQSRKRAELIQRLQPK
jgi:hypothetical protein